MVSGPLFNAGGGQLGGTLAAAHTARDGYNLNTFSGERIDGRDATIGQGQQRLDGAALSTLLNELRRVLKPGGRLRAHGLCASKPLPANGAKLPGPAAFVQRIPVEAEPVAALARAGFTQVFLEKLPEKPNFIASGVELREFLVTASNPVPDTLDIATLIYRGPFDYAQQGAQRFERGQRAWIAAQQANALRNGPAAAQFVFLERVEAAPGCDPADGCC